MNNIIQVAEQLYREANPTSTMEPPSLVYEAIENRYKRWLMLTKEQKEAYDFLSYARILNSRNNLTKKQAKLCLEWGYRVSHKRFLKNEWISQYKNDKSLYLDEHNNIIKKSNFWKYRADSSIWKTHYFII